MRVLHGPPRAAVLAWLFLACGPGKPSSGTPCQHNFDCKAGESCADGTCQALPCGGCQPDQACGTDGNCIAAQGAACGSVTSCPAGYPCNKGNVCAKPCTTNSQCDTGFVCNSGLQSCAQCTFSSDCGGKKGNPVCDTDPSAGAAASRGRGGCVAFNGHLRCVEAGGRAPLFDAPTVNGGCGP